MPTYEYKCRECADQFEIVQSFSDKPLKKCKKCGGQLGKVFGSIGISFKGSGFYRTDSRSGSAATVGKSDKAKAEKSGGETKSDASKSDGASSSSESKKSETKPSKDSGSKSSKKPASAA